MIARVGSKSGSHPLLDPTRAITKKSRDISAALGLKKICHFALNIVLS